MDEPAYPTTWTDADFDSLCWHDNTVHGLRLHNPVKDFSFDLILDIDYILEWLCGSEGGSLRFVVAPAQLVFSNVDHLHIDVELSYKEALVLDELGREEITTDAQRRAGLRIYRWTLSLHSSADHTNRITFEAESFKQTLTRAPVTIDRQDLAEDQR